MIYKRYLWMFVQPIQAFHFQTNRLRGLQQSTYRHFAFARYHLNKLKMINGLFYLFRLKVQKFAVEKKFKKSLIMILVESVKSLIK